MKLMNGLKVYTQRVYVGSMGPCRAKTRVDTKLYIPFTIHMITLKYSNPLKTKDAQNKYEYRAALLGEQSALGVRYCAPLCTTCTFTPNIIYSSMKLWLMLTGDHNQILFRIVLVFVCTPSKHGCRTVFATYNTVTFEVRERMAISSSLWRQLQCTCTFSPARFL